MKTDEISAIKERLKSRKKDLMRKAKKVELGLVAMDAARKHRASESKESK